MVPLGLFLTGGSATGQFTSSAGQAMTLNVNPLFGGGTLDVSGSTGADAAPVSAPTQTAEPVSSSGGAAAGYPLGTASAALPATSTLSSSTLIWLALGGALILIFSGGSESSGRRR